MTCQVRSATSSDSAGISRVVVAALRGTNAEDYSADVIAQVEKGFAPESVRKLIERRKVFVAMQGEDITGTASLDGNVVRSVFVDPVYQGRGIGRQLMQEIHGTAASAGVKVLRVPSSITAEKFYAALGYQKIRDEFYGAERTIVMEKRM